MPWPLLKEVGRGGNAPTSIQNQCVDDEQVVQEEEVPNNVVQSNDKVQFDIDDSVKETQKEVNPSMDHIIDIPELVVQKAKTPLAKTPPPYPQRLSKQNGENKFKKFIKMMNSLSINVPLVKALKKMPGYEKFMKDLMMKKRSMNFETIKVTHQVSAIVHSMAPKLEDPGAFTIPCTIANGEFSKALCDLGKNCVVDYEVPIILGRVFLATGKALCDVGARELTFRVGEEQVVFQVATINIGDMLEAVLINFDDDETDGFMECVNSLQGMGSYNYAPQKLSLDLENKTTPPIKPSIEEPPAMELTPLPSHLRYELFIHCSTLPFILSYCLTNVKVDSTLAVLQKRKKAIRWTLPDIREIRPTFVLHKIN
ncbi:uncharacterized protein [Nicotiana tomentosiformis]|uniref:uncharacterized protein n=1 Tax=Nicotiana tomentosiformis TaxID=4098 RepID=UPI00388C8CE1